MGSNAAGTISSPSRTKERQTVPVTVLGDLVLFKNVPLPLSFAAGDLATESEKFEKILNGLRRHVIQQKRIKLTTEERDEYLRALRDAGKTASNKIWDKSAREQLDSFDDEFGERGLRYTLTTPPEFAFPWEMLYRGDPLGAVDASQFWGFRYPIGRFFITSNFRSRSEVYLRNGLLSAVHSGLKHSRKETDEIAELVATLSREAGREFLRDPLDVLVAAEEQAATILEKLILKFSDEAFNYGIVHFACHASNPGDDEGAGQAKLGFSLHERALWVSLDEIIGMTDYRFKHYPFVFLNACESATLGHLLQKSTFPYGFLAYGAASVIATACIMPDIFASAFAREFYRRLLDPARGPFVFVSDILWETRLHFLQEYNNPLGLAYGLYALSDQKFRYT